MKTLKITLSRQSFVYKVRKELHEWFDKRHKGADDIPPRKEEGGTDFDKSKLKLDKYSRRETLQTSRKGKKCYNKKHVKTTQGLFNPYYKVTGYLSVCTEGSR